MTAHTRLVMKNRSLPSDTVLPHVFCEDPEAMAEWLQRVFGFSEHYRFGKPVSGMQVYLGNAYIMLKRVSGEGKREAACQSHYLTVFVSDVDAHYERAKSAGATITEELNETCYGERQYVAVDPEGHIWLFSQHVRDLGPDEWGATLAVKP